jgi:hypothetical protein
LRFVLLLRIFRVGRREVRIKIPLNKIGHDHVLEKNSRVIVQKKWSKPFLKDRDEKPTAPTETLLPSFQPTTTETTLS